jgi:hypothetical protein
MRPRHVDLGQAVRANVEAANMIDHADDLGPLLARRLRREQHSSSHGGSGPASARSAGFTSRTASSVRAAIVIRTALVR